MTTINAFVACRVFLAVKMHFTSKNYDYFKYNGKVNLSVDTFGTRKDRFLFHKLAGKYKGEDYLDMVVANLIRNRRLYSRELLSEEAETELREYQKRIQSLSYLFTQDIDKMIGWAESNNTELDDFLKVPKNGNPLLLEWYYHKKVSLETLAILEKILKIFKNWDKNIADTIVWPDTRDLIVKYLPFINIDPDKFIGIIKTRMKDST